MKGFIVITVTASFLRRSISGGKVGYNEIFEMFYLKIFNIFDTNRLYFFLFQIYNCSDIVWIEFVDRKCHWLKYCEIPRLKRGV